MSASPLGRPVSFRVERAGSVYETDVVPREYRERRDFNIPLLLDVDADARHLHWSLGPLAAVAGYHRRYLPSRSRRANVWERFHFLLGAVYWVTTPTERYVRLLWLIRLTGKKGGG